MPSEALDTAHLGHRRDEPDSRDVRYVAPDLGTLPPSVDLRAHCAPAYAQGHIKSCSANALSSVLTYLGNKNAAPIEAPSRLFIYWNERVLAGTQDSDAGSTLRYGIKAVAKQGACAETLWPYDPTLVCTQPKQACFDAASVRAISYASIEQHIDPLKTCLADGFPFVFGMAVYPSMFHPQADFSIPLPGANETSVGDHAVMAAGYDDQRKALLVLNSVGTAWGQQGYFYMPYDYVTSPNLTYDFWTIRSIT